MDEGDDVRSNALARNVSGAFGEVDRSRCATATYDFAAAAGVSQSQGLTFAQVNSALNNF